MTHGAQSTKVMQWSTLDKPRPVAHNVYVRGSNSVVECLPSKQDVASSNLVSRSTLHQIVCMFYDHQSLRLLGGIGKK